MCQCTYVYCLYLDSTLTLCQILAASSSNAAPLCTVPRRPDAVSGTRLHGPTNRYLIHVRSSVQIWCALKGSSSENGSKRRSQEPTVPTFGGFDTKRCLLKNSQNISNLCMSSVHSCRVLTRSPLQTGPPTLRASNWIGSSMDGRQSKGGNSQTNASSNESDKEIPERWMKQFSDQSLAGHDISGGRWIFLSLPHWPFALGLFFMELRLAIFDAYPNVVRWFVSKAACRWM